MSASMTYKHWRIERDSEGLAWLWFDKAGESTNTFSSDAMDELRAIVASLAAATAAGKPRGLVVLSAKESGFIAGADVREFMRISTPDEATALVRRGWETFNEFAALPFPTLALIRGFCMGGGLELALACTYRIAVDEPGTRLALPEVLLGIVPGWGGMRRLPQTIGAPAALDMMLTGKTVDARKAKRLGLVDEAVPVRVMMNAARVTLTKLPPRHAPGFAQQLTLAGPVRRLIANGLPILFEGARQKTERKARRVHYPAPHAIIDIWVEHDGDPFGFPPAHPSSLQSILASPATQNLIRIFGLQERLKSLAKDTTFKAQHVHVIGAGTMGGDIAAWCALRGMRVTLQDQSAEKLAPAMGRAAKLFKDRLKEPRRIRDATDLLIPDVAGDGVKRADVIIEAVFENLAVKQKIFAGLEQKARPDAILATNTSSLSVEAMGADVGLHFFNPVAVLPLVEVVRTSQTTDEQLVTAFDVVKKLKKRGVLVTDAPAFVVNRVLTRMTTVLMDAIENGNTVEETDDAALSLGLPMAPSVLLQMVGPRVANHVLETLHASYPDRFPLSPTLANYADGKDEIVVRGNARRTVDEIREDALEAIADEVRCLLDEGVVEAAADVDACLILGAGYPFFLGGITKHLDQTGISERVVGSTLAEYGKMPV